MYNILMGATRQGHSIESEFQVQAERYRIFFRSRDALLSSHLESDLAAMLLPCMSTGGGTISAQGEISQRLLAALPTVQDIYCMWLPSYRRAQVVNVTPVVRKASAGKRVAAFFSAGVDSGYTLLMHLDEITDLVLIHGLETHLDNVFLRERLSTNVRRIAAAFGKNVIEIETNVRELFDPYVDFGHWSFGVGLMTVSHLLSSTFRRIFIPGGRTYSILGPTGSHPLLDPLWSTEAFEIIYDGLEATRAGKVAQISKYDVLLNSLHVCHKNDNGIYNCGRCEKCLRTMINLEMNGVLDRCTAFDIPLKVKHILQLELLDSNTEFYVRENLQTLETQGGNKALIKALRTILNRPLWLRKLRRRMKAYQRGFARRFARLLA